MDKSTSNSSSTNDDDNDNNNSSFSEAPDDFWYYDDDDFDSDFFESPAKDNNPEDTSKHPEKNQENHDATSFHCDIALPIERPVTKGSNDNRPGARPSDSHGSDRRRVTHPERNAVSNNQSSESVLESPSDVLTENINATCKPINLLATSEEVDLKFSSLKSYNSCAGFKKLTHMQASEENTNSNNTPGSTLGATNNTLIHDALLSNEPYLQVSAAIEEWLGLLAKDIKIPIDVSLTLQSSSYVISPETVQNLYTKLILIRSQILIETCLEKTSYLPSEETDSSKQCDTFEAAGFATPPCSAADKGDGPVECSVGSVEPGNSNSQSLATYCSKQTGPEATKHSRKEGLENTETVDDSTHKIDKCYPFVSALNSDKISSHCSNCFKMLERRSAIQCLSCEICFYCNEACQESYFDIHSKECNLLLCQRCPSAVVRSLAHLYWKCQDRVFRAAINVIEIPPVVSDDTESYNVKRREAKSKLDYFFDERFTISDEYFNELYAKFCRCFLVIQDLTEDLGVGMYIGLADVQHSCCPSANVVFIGNEMQIIRARNVPDDLVTISFIDVLKPKKHRHEELIPITGGYCYCQRCGDCTFEERIGGHHTDFSRRAGRTRTAIDVAEELQRGIVPEDIVSHLERMKEQSGPFHWNYVTVLQSIAFSCENREIRKKDEVLRTRDYCYNELSDIYEELLGLCHTMTIRTIFQHGMFLSSDSSSLFLSSRSSVRAALQCLRKAVNAATETFGRNHSYTETIRAHLDSLQR